MTAPLLILLHPDDNVLVCARPTAAGDEVTIDGAAVTVHEAIGTAHKVARTAADIGDKVIKYGMPIGSFTKPVAPGDWVHLHNMKSDYMDPHTRAGLATGAE
jgi:hypothetical protein